MSFGIIWLSKTPQQQEMVKREIESTFSQKMKRCFFSQIKYKEVKSNKKRRATHQG